MAELGKLTPTGELGTSTREVPGGEMQAEPAEASALGGEVAFEPQLGLFGDIVDELRWRFRGPKSWLLMMVGNLAVASISAFYQHYDPHTTDHFRIANLATEVVAFTLSGVINTNQLGYDIDRVRNSMERGDSVLRILLKKGAAIATFVLPVAVAISAGFRVSLGWYSTIGEALMADIAVVALWVGLGALASVITVYRPLRLKERVQAIRERRGVVHLALCLATPYALYFIVAPRLGWPADYIGTHRLLGHGEAGLYAVQAVRMVLYVGLAALAYALAWLYAERHRACLEEDLRRTC